MREFWLLASAAIIALAVSIVIPVTAAEFYLLAHPDLDSARDPAIILGVGVWVAEMLFVMFGLGAWSAIAACRRDSDYLTV